MVFNYYLHLNVITYWAVASYRRSHFEPNGRFYCDVLANPTIEIKYKTYSVYGTVVHIYVKYGFTIVNR